jgi:hypothetical protein
MCTISVVPPYGERGWRLMVNRDEKRTRPVAWPPLTTRLAGATVTYPVDSDALGTWVAASDLGLAFAVMNVSPAVGLLPQRGTTTRGTIIPMAAPAATLDEALERVRSLPLASIAPFRVIIASADGIAWAHWDGRSLRTATEPLVRARLFASSGLGDHLVQGPREELFERLLQQERDPWRAQDRLHLHAWPDRRHLSVNMSRTDARTVSCTTVVATDAAISLTYVPYLEGWPGPATTRALAHTARRLAGAA